MVNTRVFQCATPRHASIRSLWLAVSEKIVWGKHTVTRAEVAPADADVDFVGFSRSIDDRSEEDWN